MKCIKIIPWLNQSAIATYHSGPFLFMQLFLINVIFYFLELNTFENKWMKIVQRSAAQYMCAKSMNNNTMID